MSEWVKCRKRLPDEGGLVIVSTEGEYGEVLAAELIRGKWYAQGADEPMYYTPTHWMPLPEPPKH